MNGTVTMNSTETGIIAGNYEEALEILKKHIIRDIIIEKKKPFCFRVSQKEGTVFEVHCILKEKPIRLWVK